VNVRPELGHLNGRVDSGALAKNNWANHGGRVLPLVSGHLSQVRTGYDPGNGSKGAVQGTLGADFNVGPDVILGPWSPHRQLHQRRRERNSQRWRELLGIVKTRLCRSFRGDDLRQHKRDASGKHAIDKLRLLAGYEWMQFAPPRSFAGGDTAVNSSERDRSDGRGESRTTRRRTTVWSD
jgi:hypothetical protein